MSRYRDPQTGEIIYVGEPKLNPELIAGKELIPEGTDVSAITSSALAPTPTPTEPFRTAPTSQPTSIQGITADIPKIEPAPIEKEGDVLSERLRAINESLLGRGAFRREREAEFGVSAAQQALDDLEARLRDLERQEKAIPLQIQQEFAGRGATKGGVAPIETGRLRENAIEALTVSALIDAASNRLTSAQRKVDRAVEEKYGPLLEEQAIKLANLEIILKSPAYSRAEKERAEKQKLIEEQRKEKLEKEKKEQEEIWKVATDAAKGGADSVTLEKIRTAKTKEEALQLATPFFKKTDITAMAGSVEEFKLIHGRMPKDLKELNEFTASRGAAGRKPEEPPLKPTVGFFDPKIESSVREDFVELANRYKNPAAPTEEEKESTFRTLRNLYSPQEASDDALRSLIGIRSPTEVTETPQVDQTTQNAASSWLGGIGEKVRGFFKGFKKGFKESSKFYVRK